MAKSGSRICVLCRRAYEVNRLNGAPILREAARVISKKYREAKPEETRAAMQRWLAANPNYMKNWRLNKKKQEQNG